MLALPAVGAQLICFLHPRSCRFVDPYMGPPEEREWLSRGCGYGFLLGRHQSSAKLHLVSRLVIDSQIKGACYIMLSLPFNITFIIKIM